MYKRQLAASFLAGGRLAVDPAWVAVAVCGIPILKEVAVGLVTRFDIKADVLAVSYTHLDVYKRQPWVRVST